MKTASQSSLLSEFDKLDMDYADDFCAGWHLSACGTSFETIAQRQATNNAYHGKNKTPSRKTSGMVDGCMARLMLLKPVDASAKQG